MFMMANGQMIRLTDMEAIIMLMVQSIAECGKTIYKMEKVLKNGQMVLLILAGMKMEGSLASAIINGVMDLGMEESG
jgi:hypothetical protein